MFDIFHGRFGAACSRTSRGVRLLLSPWRLAASVVLAIATTTAGQVAEGSNPRVVAGYVAGIAGGTWLAVSGGNTERLTLGSTVRSGDELRMSGPPDASARVVLVLYSSGQAHSFKAGSTVPSGSNPAQGNALLAALRRRLSDRLVSGIGRGMSNASSVVIAQNEEIPLRTLFGSVSPGRYTLAARRLGSDGRVLGDFVPAPPLGLSVSPQGPVSLGLPIRRGLWQVVLSPADGVVPPGIGWVLVTGSPAVVQDWVRLERSLDQISELESGHASVIRERLRRAALLELNSRDQ